jgi:hypothetical protein
MAYELPKLLLRITQMVDSSGQRIVKACLQRFANTVVFPVT